MRFFLYFFSLVVLVIFAPYNFLHAVKCPHCDHLRGEECFTVKTAVTQRGGGATGKWKDTVTPKRGWTCINAEDLGKGNTQKCEMCEKQPARYLHYMRHGALQLKVGCDCSAYMEGRLDDYDIDSAIAMAINRENRSERRAHFPNLQRPKWKKSGENSYINYKKRHIAIFPSRSNPGRYSVCIDKDPKLVPGSYASTLEAKLAAFDYLDPFPLPAPYQSPVLQTPIGLRRIPSAAPASYQLPVQQYPTYPRPIPSATPAPYQPPTLQYPIDPRPIPSATPAPYQPPTLQYPIDPRPIPSAAPTPYQLPVQQYPTYPGPIPSVALAPYQLPVQQYPTYPGPIPSVAPAPYQLPVQQYPTYPGPIPSVAPAPYQLPTQQHPTYPGPIPSAAPAPYHSQQGYIDEEIIKQLDNAHL